MDGIVAGLVGGWIAHRRPGESFPAFATRSTDEELAALAGIPAAPRKGQEAR
jgi:hypothetical protein